MPSVPIELAHFWAKVEIPSPARCWLWRGGRKGRDAGYGKFRDTSAHRYAYQMHKGEIPHGMMVRHMCGNKLCVNPAHLALGTAVENYADRFILGEATGGVGEYGLKNPKAKLTEDAAAYIRENPDGMRCTDLAVKFGVSKATVSLIQSGKRRAA